MNIMIKYYFYNMTCFILNIFILTILIKLVANNYLKLTSIQISMFSHVIIMPVSFIINNYYVFNSNSGKFKANLKKFIITATSFFFIYYFILHFLIYFGIFTITTHIISTIISSLINFKVLNNWVFISSTKPIDKTNILLHADDYGLNEEISMKIFHCIDRQKIFRTSVICNTNYITKASEFYNLCNTKFEIGLHLNLVEGKPLSQISEVYLLVNKVGEFKFSFISLWIFYTFSRNSKRKLIKQQIEFEIIEQIDKFKVLFSKEQSSIHIDGHTHIHMIPFILDIILEKSKHHNITSIRLPNEIFYFDFRTLKNYLSTNVLKYIILKFLCILQIRKIKRNKIKYNDYLIGILSSGEMTATSLQCAINAINRKNHKDSVTEILFHPGGISNKRNIDWTKKNQFINYYNGSKRRKEFDFIIGNNFNKLINQFKKISKL